MKVVWSETALRDLTAARDYFARDSQTYALTFAERIITAAERISDSPRSGRAVPEAEDPKIREILSQGHHVMHRILADTVQILAVVHGVRDVGGMDKKPWDDE
jgi:plasmid stabilization system protein ParE